MDHPIAVRSAVIIQTQKHTADGRNKKVCGGEAERLQPVSHDTHSKRWSDLSVSKLASINCVLFKCCWRNLQKTHSKLTAGTKPLHLSSEKGKV